MNLTFRRALTSLSRRIDHLLNGERRKDTTKRIMKLQSLWDTALSVSDQAVNNPLTDYTKHLLFADIVAKQLQAANPYFGDFTVMRVQPGLEQIREQLPALMMDICWPRERKIGCVAIYRHENGTARIALSDHTQLAIDPMEPCLVHYQYRPYSFAGGKF